MSLRTLFIWIIIAGVLGAGALLVRQREAHRERQREIEWVGLEFDPASVVGLEIERTDSSVRLLRDQESIDRWVGRWDAGRGEEEWAITATRVRGALRALATARIRLGDENLMQDEDGRIAITSRDGSSTVLLAGSGRSGGRTPVRIEQRDESGAIERVVSGWLESSVADALAVNTVRSWRDMRLMNLAASSVTRLGLTAGSNRVSLARRAGGWWITEPIELHADQQAVDTLVKSLLVIKAERFEDADIDDATSGLNTPLASIEVGTEDSLTELTVGTRADISGDTLYARFARSGASALIQVSTDALSKLTASPGAYVSKFAGAYASTSVRSVAVSGRDGVERMRANRDGSQWQIGESNADMLTNEAIDRLVSIMLRQPAAGVRLVDAAFELPKEIARVSLLDAKGQELGSYRIALEQSASGMQLLVVDELADGQRVVWAYVGDDAQATGTWLTIAASRRMLAD